MGLLLLPVALGSRLMAPVVRLRMMDWRGGSVVSACEGWPVSRCPTFLCPYREARCDWHSHNSPLASLFFWGGGGCWEQEEARKVKRLGEEIVTLQTSLDTRTKELKNSEQDKRLLNLELEKLPVCQACARALGA
jgi:hypothetical protein